MRARPRLGPPGRITQQRKLWLGVAAAVVALIIVILALGGTDSLSTANRRLTTPWTSKVSSMNPLPEYPRPQMVRTQWQNLNGPWQFEASSKLGLASPPFGKKLADTIIVPFPVQARLSGIERSDVLYMWYRTEFTVPAAWVQKRVLLHFGAVDWEATVYLNGKPLGSHRGGFSKFFFDITDNIRSHAGSVQELAVGVWDPSESADGVPVGKQRYDVPGNRTLYLTACMGAQSILYTASSGIWRTVWLEPVPDRHVTSVDVVPDVDTSSLSMVVQGSDDAVGLDVKVAVSDKGKEVAASVGRVGRPFQVDVPNARLWSPDSPYLYDLDVWIVDAKSAASASDVTMVDHVRSYCGMRKISLGRDSQGTLRLMLNDEFIFQMGMLDQGFWPDGLYTAPTDAALMHDITTTKSIGMNMLRKHVKVEPDRWYYHADRLGLLVWQDMPSMCGAKADTWYADCWTANRTINAASKAQFERELQIMIEEHISFPSIVMWVVFNEGWGQYETERVTRLAKSLDPSRLFNCASGWYDHPVGDIIDVHDYVEPRSPGARYNRAAVLGEYGGLGYKVKNHLYNPQSAFSYIVYDTRAQLQRAYLDLLSQIKGLMLQPSSALCAAVYTELADVENEINGIMTYDRKYLRYDANVLSRAHRNLISAGRDLTAKSRVQ